MRTGTGVRQSENKWKQSSGGGPTFPFIMQRAPGSDVRKESLFVSKRDESKEESGEKDRSQRRVCAVPQA